ncbi:MAG TPA: tail fiber domain-containing protein [Thermoanaerobaculia bacterium]|nr:tail fiber domain-containing protein [Thermoanaerobaculia bacterium]
MQRLSAIAATLVFSLSLARGQESLDPSVLAGKVANWPAPPDWSPPAQRDSVKELGGGLRSEGVRALSTSPLPFIGITPCRVADTRPSQGFGGAYGPPIMAANAVRTFDIDSGPCPGIPENAQAYSLNFAVTETTGAPGDIRVFPSGTPASTTSVLNWNFVGNGAIANAVIIAAGTDGAIDVQVAGFDTHLVIDINGYYAPAGVGNFNTFLGHDAGNFTMTGDFNTGLGRGALFSNTMGAFNTATGAFALQLNTIGADNTANGEAALNRNTTGFANTASGSLALANNTSGNLNTATGGAALFANTSGDANTAIGANALGNTVGTNNIGIGFDSGLNHTVGSNNICIGNSGVVGESSTIRIGTVGIQTATFVAGISGTTSPGGVAVFIDGNGQLGTATSSRRFKEDIREISEESDGLMRLRPVAFRYKPQIDPTGLAQYGLIAEEVADVYPDLVVYDREGLPETVRYHLVNALLLNEVQKQHREIEELRRRLTRLEVRP